MSAFSITAQSSKARSGNLSGKLPTPTALLYSRKGFPAALTLRELESLAPEQGSSCIGVQTSAADFIEDAGKVIPNGLCDFCGLKSPSCFVVLTSRDALTPQTGMPASQGWVTMQTSAGQKKITVEEYIAFVGRSRVDAVAWLSDEVAGDAAERRHKTSIDRGLAWLDKGLAARDNGEIPTKTLIFGGVGGGTSERERGRSAAEVARRAVDGFVLSGMGAGESPDEREQMLSASISLLPAGRPRMVVGLGTPAEVLQCVALGIDLFESAYPYLVSSQGLAIAYPVAYADVMRRDALLSGTAADEGGKMNLRDTKYRKDTRPLVQGCMCFACQRHSRAYIHHLLNTREMLAEVLLNSHNHFQYQMFFESVRQAIADDKLQEFASAFEAARRPC